LFTSYSRGLLFFINIFLVLFVWWVLENLACDVDEDAHWILALFYSFIVDTISAFSIFLLFLYYIVSFRIENISFFFILLA
jgi:hypothetical protein